MDDGSMSENPRNSQSLFEDGPARSGSPGPSSGDHYRRAVKSAVLIVLAVGAVGVLAARRCSTCPPPVASESGGRSAAAATTAPAASLPRLIELGSVSCIPCKMMKPILDELRRDYAGRFQVDFIDVNEDREAGARYRLRVIPTQIFLDSRGRELFRHEGFFPKDQILAKWRELGVNLAADQANGPGPDSGSGPSSGG